MPLLEKLNVGLVGVAGRGGTFRTALEANGARVHAICDLSEEALDALPPGYEQAERFADYENMLDNCADLDAVVIGTPQHLHVEQAVPALERGLHVLSEVPAAVSVDECKTLVAACEASRTSTYMLAENYVYTKPNVLVREMSRQGLFGDVYYAEGEYLHELKGLAEQTTWRRHWQLGIDGNTYPTHSLGPVLQWMAGDRVARVSCEGSGQHHTDPRGEPYHQDTSVMLCKTVRGALIKIRLDLVSERPHAMNVYQLQGTNGVYESPRAPGDKHRVWLRALSEQVRWHDLEALMNVDELAARFLPDDWRNPPREALQAGHGGGDFFEVRDWVRAIKGEAPNPLGVHEALDMTLPGLVSQQSVAQNGAWLDVPDSRAWLSETASRPQLQMVLPERLLSPPPVPNVPSGYCLRLYSNADEAGYLALMNQQDFGAWDTARLARARQAVLPGGFFVIEHVATGQIVATAQSGHRPSERHLEGGELGWVAGDPEHAGRGLGRAVVSAATARLIQAGYRRIYLSTEDHRLPALKVYLSLGYEPFLYTDNMAERWQAIRQTLNQGKPS